MNKIGVSVVSLYEIYFDLGCQNLILPNHVYNITSYLENTAKLNPSPLFVLFYIWLIKSELATSGTIF